MNSGDRSSDAPPEEELVEEESELPEEETAADLPDAPESVKRGVGVIKAHWKHAPNGPGVYRMIAETARCSTSARPRTSGSGSRATPASPVM